MVVIGSGFLFWHSRKATKAAEEEMEDTMLFDGDQQRYLQLLANGGEEEMGIDASDVDSSDVASSNDIDSSDEESDDDSRDVGTLRKKLVSSVARSAGRGKRGRAEIGQSVSTSDETEESRRNPLMAEIGSRSERRQAAAQRWFNDPLFSGVDETLAATEEGDGDSESAGHDEAREPPTKRSRRAGAVVADGQRKAERGRREEAKEVGAAEALMAAMPRTEKEKRKEKRKKV